MRTPDPKVKYLPLQVLRQENIFIARLHQHLRPRLFRAVESIDVIVLSVDVDALFDSYLYVDLDDGRKLNIKDAGKQLKDNEKNHG